MSELNHLWRRAREVTHALEKWIELRDDKIVHPTFKEIDQVRLLKLVTWSIRYRLPVVDILDLVIPVLRPLVPKKLQRSLLGVPLRMLLGPGAEKILISQIKKQFPDGQHLTVWISDEQERHLALEEKDALDGMQMRSVKLVNILDAESVTAHMRAYNRMVRRERDRGDKARSQKWRGRKHYRGNPWI